MTKTWKKIVALAAAVAVVVPVLASCGGGGGVAIDKENPEIQIMTKAFQAESAQPDSPVLQALEELVGTKLNMTWSPSTSYDEKVTTSMGSGTYPHAMLVGARSSSVIQAARNDIFWDLTDIFSDTEKYPYLSQASELVNHNISIDGKVFGIYRARELGRAGVSIRKDWLANVGLETPKTVDEFYNVLKAFKEQDPDKNGQDDTYGMIVTNYLAGPLNNLALWMGAPNLWGLDENGELAPSFMFDEYTDALKLMRQMYEEGLINSDMATYSSDKWNEQFLSGQAGVIIDVADRARRLAQNMEDQDSVDVFGYVTKDAATEPRTLPTTGYDGYYVLPKPAVSEEDLDFVLGVMDKLNSLEAVNLMNYGIEGRNYELDAEGYVVKKDDPEIVKEYADLNQLSMGICTFDNALKTRYTAPVAEKIDQVYEENRGYAVPNPAEPYVSATYSKKGPQLDSIMDEAKTKFIVGQIDEAAYLAEIERWKTMGGADVIKEMNEAYQADDSVEK